MSDEKKIVIILRQAPHGTLFPVEGLRMAVALCGDFEPLILVINDAVYAFIEDVDKTMYQTHINFIKGIDLDIIVDKKSLTERGLSEDNLIEAVNTKEHKDILQILSDCDVAIPF